MPALNTRSLDSLLTDKGQLTLVWEQFPQQHLLSRAALWRERSRGGCGVLLVTAGQSMLSPHPPAQHWANTVLLLPRTSSLA